MQSASIRVDAATHRERKKLASSMGSSVGDTVALAVRRLRQDRIAEELRNELMPEEKTWLDASPSVVHVVPLTSTLRGFGSEVTVAPDPRNRLERESSAQCQHLRSVSVQRLDRDGENVGPASLSQVRDVIALVLDLPG